MNIGCSPVFHIELRQFPNVARAFNLSGEELQQRFVRPWLDGRTIELDEHRFSPEKARLTIYEGRALATDEIGMGRGWGNVTRTGTEVTDRVLEAAHDPSLAQLKGETEARVPLTLRDVLALANERWPERRASERLALAEMAVWELLHQRRVRMSRDGQPVAPEEWQPIILAWETWSADAGSTLLIEA
jgi:hypothetical protein